MKWVLIAVMWWSNGLTMEDVNFDDEPACLEAMEAIKKSWGTIGVAIVCVPTSTNKQE
jgi:hypothetical protein